MGATRAAGVPRAGKSLQPMTTQASGRCPWAGISAPPLAVRWLGDALLRAGVRHHVPLDADGGREDRVPRGDRWLIQAPRTRGARCGGSVPGLVLGNGLGVRHAEHGPAGSLWARGGRSCGFLCEGRSLPTGLVLERESWRGHGAPSLRCHCVVVRLGLDRRNRPAPQISPARARIPRETNLRCLPVLHCVAALCFAAGAARPAPRLIGSLHKAAMGADLAHPRKEPS